MSKYTIGEVSELLGIRIHTIRYWEKQIPLISVQRDEAGKRVYGKQDVFILSQLHHLIVKKKYTLKGASDELVQLLETEEKQTHKKIYFDVLKKFKNQKKLFEEANSLVLEIKENKPHVTKESVNKKKETKNNEV